MGEEGSPGWEWGERLDASLSLCLWRAESHLSAPNAAPLPTRCLGEVSGESLG